jgi:hypothetical protein
MDPEATWRILNAESADRDDRDFAALDLLVWLAKGGAMPLIATAGLRPRADLIERCELRLVARTLPRRAHVRRDTMTRKLTITYDPRDHWFHIVEDTEQGGQHGYRCVFPTAREELGRYVSGRVGFTDPLLGALMDGRLTRITLEA